LLGNRESISNVEERVRFPENGNWESDAPFRLRTPLMPNASRFGEMHHEGHRAESSKVAELIDLYWDG
jgi:hypothetical protein